RVERREERRHRVRVRVVELDPIEARSLRALGRAREEIGEDAREIADVREVHVRHALARADPQRLELVAIEDRVEEIVVALEEAPPNIAFGGVAPRGLAELRSEVLAVRARDLEEASEVARSL